jgi:hypothetical protein
VTRASDSQRLTSGSRALVPDPASKALRPAFGGVTSLGRGGRSDSDPKRTEATQAKAARWEKVADPEAAIVAFIPVVSLSIDRQKYQVKEGAWRECMFHAVASHPFLWHPL